MAVRAFEREVLPHLASGRMRPVIDTIVPYERATEAFERMAASGKRGKVLAALRVSDASPARRASADAARGPRARACTPSSRARTRGASTGSRPAWERIRSDVGDSRRMLERALGELGDRRRPRACSTSAPAPGRPPASSPSASRGADRRRRRLARR